MHAEVRSAAQQSLQEVASRVTSHGISPTQKIVPGLQAVKGVTWCAASRTWTSLVYMRSSCRALNTWQVLGAETDKHVKLPQHRMAE